MKRKIQNVIWKIKCIASEYKMKREINKGIKSGYILEDGTPIKCHKCNSKNLEEYNHDYIEHMICEYDKKCKDCGRKLGHWSYGMDIGNYNNMKGEIYNEQNSWF